MSRPSPRLRSGLGLAFVLGALTPLSVSSQVGSVTGRIRDAATQRPVVGAQIQIVATEQGQLSDADGRFRINDVPVGPQQLRVVVIGFTTQTREITVLAGQATEVDVQLTSEAIGLDELVITVTGERRARQVTNKVTRVSGADIAASTPATSVSDLLVGKAAGVQVIGASGATGSGSRIRIRGASSISLSNEPVVFVDGVRIDSSPQSASINVGGQTTSRLGDLNPEEIESIEVVRGPSAVTLYGTDAANGVIRITTKGGTLGTTSFNVYAETGLIQDANSYYANWASDCPASFVAAGTCAQTTLTSWNPLEERISTPFVTGGRQQYGVNLRGGSERLNYFVSGEWEQEDGVLGIPEFDLENLREQSGDVFNELPSSLFKPNSLERVSLRANLGGSISDNLNFNTRVGFVTSDLQRPTNDNHNLGILPSALLGTADGTEAGRFGYRFLVPSEANFNAVSQDVTRFTGSSQFDWQPLGWLSGRATIGLDQVTRTDIQNVPRDRIFFGATLPLGQRTVNTARITNATFDANVSASLRINGTTRSRTSIGTQYFVDHFTRSDAFGADMVSGCTSLACTGREFTVGETTQESKTLGVFIDQEVSFHDRLFLNAAVRVDDNSAFGRDFDAIIYPKLGASWVVSEEPFFPKLPFTSSLRLRAAWGASGAQPGPTDALRYFNSTPVTLNGQDVVGVTIGELGNPDLEPEQSSEIEVGLDWRSLHDRLAFNLTYYDKTTTDLLIAQPLPPSGGVGEDRFVNLGEVSNTGWELGLDARILESQRAVWDVGLQFATNNNALVDLGRLPNGDPVPEIKGLLGFQWFVEGYPLGSYWDFGYTYDDVNGDGILSVDEVAVAGEESYLGTPIPTRNFSAQSSVTLFDRVRISALLEYRGGHRLLNFTEDFRCQYGICRGFHDPSASLEEQARAIAAALAPRVTSAGMVEDASFWKLRELGATVFIPDSWLTRLGARAGSFTLTGRNLLLFTDYTGADPEVNMFGNANFWIIDFLTQPPVRTLVARINLSY